MDELKKLLENAGVTENNKYVVRATRAMPSDSHPADGKQTEVEFYIVLAQNRDDAEARLKDKIDIYQIIEVEPARLEI